MRWILWACVALGVVWSGLWFAASTVVDRGMTQWFADQAELGMTATQTDVSVSGFPSRLDLTVTAPRIADPVTGWGWNAPFAQVLAMTWKPWHLIAALPQDQLIEAPGQKITLRSSKMLGSARVQPSGDLTLEEIVVEGHDLQATSDLGWQIGAKSLVFAVQRDATRAHGLRIGLDVTEGRPDPALQQALPGLGSVIDTLQLDVGLELTAAIDRHMAETAPKVQEILVKDLTVNWGDLRITAKGKVVAAASGAADGKVDFRIEGWREIPGLMVAFGWVLPDMGKTLERGFEVLAKSGPDPDVLDLALTFAEGRMTLGPLPLGPAPMLR